MRNQLKIGALIGVGLLAFGGPANAALIKACDFTTETFGTGAGQTVGPDGITLANASCSVKGSTGANVLFQIPTGPNSVGTGLIEPFLTVQASGNKDQESGFNTDKDVKDVKDAAGNQLDIKRVGQAGQGGFTNSLLFGQIPKVTVDGTVYREILLDINQIGTGHLSLDVIRFFKGDGTGNLADFYSIVPTSYDTSGVVKQGGAGGTALELLWSLDYPNGQGKDQMLLLDYNVCAKSLLGACPKGSGNTYDLRYLIPESIFTARQMAADDYFVMYTSFGWQPCDSQIVNNKGEPARCFNTNDGFEEWAIRKACDPNDPACNPYNVPEPGTLALLGVGLLGVGLARRRRHAVL